MSRRKEYEIAFRLGAKLESRFNKAFQSATGDIQKLQKQMGELNNRSSKTASMLTKLGGAIAGAFAVNKIVGVGRDIVKTFADFEQGMANVRAVSGATESDFDKLTKKAREMGERTSKSASEAADGLQYLALAGWNTQQMLDGIEPVLRLSEAGAFDLGRASDLTTDSMSALGLQVQDLPGYLDKAAQASRKSNTSIQQLMEAMVVAGGTFNTFNVPLEESTTLLGALANRGFKGGEAGTALNAIMVNLTSGVGQAGKMMKELGLSAFDTQGQFKGMETVLREVKAKLDPMTDAQRSQAISLIAGKEHLKTFTGLLDALGNEYDKLKGDIQSADGALMDMAETQMNTTAGSFKLLQSAMESAKITIGEKLAPEIRKLADWTANKLPAAAKKFADKLPAMIEQLKQIVKIGGKLLPVLAGIAGGLAAIKVGKGIADGAKNLLSLGGAASGAAKGTGLLRLATLALGGPVGWVTTGIGLLAGGIIAYRKHQEAARQATIRMGDTLREAAGKYQEVANKADQTKQLTEEYRALQEQIESNALSDDQLAAAKERLTEVVSQLQALYPDTISQYDIENDLIREKIGLLEREAEADKQLAALKLESDILEQEKKLPALKEQIATLNEQVDSLSESAEKQREAKTALKEYNLEFQKLMRMDASDERTQKLEELRGKINEAADAFGYHFEHLLGFQDAYEKMGDKLQENVAKLGEKSGELKAAQDSYQTLYDQQVALIELNLGGKLEEQAQKFNQLSDEEKRRFDSALKSLELLNQEMNAIPSSKKVEIDIQYKTPGIPAPKKQNGLFDLPAWTLPQFADGGITNRPSMFGEAGPEAAIPLNNAPRSHALLDKVNKIMGHSSGGVQVTWAPSYTISGGNAQEVREAMAAQEKLSLSELKRMLERLAANERRLSF